MSNAKLAMLPLAVALQLTMASTCLQLQGTRVGLLRRLVFAGSAARKLDKNG